MTNFPRASHSKQHKRVAVEGKVLDRYVGRYSLPPDIILTIRFESNANGRVTAMILHTDGRDISIKRIE